MVAHRAVTVTVWTVAIICCLFVLLILSQMGPELSAAGASLWEVFAGPTRKAMRP